MIGPIRIAIMHKAEHTQIGTDLSDIHGATTTLIACATIAICFHFSRTATGNTLFVPINPSTMAYWASYDLLTA